MLGIWQEENGQMLGIWPAENGILKSVKKYLACGNLNADNCDYWNNFTQQSNAKLNAKLFFSS